MAKRKPTPDGILTDEFCAKAGVGMHRDGPTGVPGFLLRVGQRERSFAIRLERRGEKAQNHFLGTWPAVSADAARADAKEKRRRFDANEPVVDVAPKAGHTIATAWPLFKGANRKGTDLGKKPLTIAAHRTAFNRFTDEVRNMSLRTLSAKPEIIAAEMTRIARDRGPVAARMTAKFLAALYTYVRKFHERDLPIDQPGQTVEIRGKVLPKRPVLMLDEMVEWNTARRAIGSPILRDYLLFALLSGLRREDLETMRWENVKWKDGKVVIPAPKGNIERGPFDLVLTWPMIACLIRLKRAVVGTRYAGSRWVFPGESRDSVSQDGVVVEAGHIRHVTDATDLKANHALRRGMASAAADAGIPESVIDQLQDHRPKTMAGIHYVRRSGAFLYGVQSTISRRIVAGLGGCVALRDTGT